MIEKLKSVGEAPIELLLLADPSKNLILNYLKKEKALYIKKIMKF